MDRQGELDFGWTELGTVARKLAGKARRNRENGEKAASRLGPAAVTGGNVPKGTLRVGDDAKLGTTTKAEKE